MCCSIKRAMVANFLASSATLAHPVQQDTYESGKEKAGSVADTVAEKANAAGNAVKVGCAASQLFKALCSLSSRTMRKQLNAAE